MSTFLTVYQLTIDAIQALTRDGSVNLRVALLSHLFMLDISDFSTEHMLDEICTLTRCFIHIGALTQHPHTLKTAAAATAKVWLS